MTKYISYIIALALILVFHLSYLPNFIGWAGKINLFVIFIVLIVLKEGLTKGLIWAAVCGVILDSFSYSQAPIFLFSFSVSALIIFYINKKIISHQNLFTKLISIAIFTFTNYLVIILANLAVSVGGGLETYKLFLKDTSLSLLWQIPINIAIALALITISKGLKRVFSQKFILKYE